MLINSHFAKLADKSNFVILSDGTKESAIGVKWNPYSKFPEISEDVLLYLILMGSKNAAPFKAGNARNVHDGKVPYVHLLYLIMQHPNFKQSQLDLSNSAQSSTDGNLLESILTTCICAASHSNGIAGTP
ncbi:hypothetical protein HK100_009058, partial [Physocladia obscura]